VASQPRSPSAVRTAPRAARPRRPQPRSVQKLEL